MSAESCPTVTVKGVDGNALIINLTDYESDPSAWELFDAPEAPVAPTITSAADPVSVQMVVTKEGRGNTARYFVTDTAKTKIVGVAGVDEGGYENEGAAWAAIMAANTVAA